MTSVVEFSCILGRRTDLWLLLYLFCDLDSYEFISWLKDEYFAYARSSPLGYRFRVVGSTPPAISAFSYMIDCCSANAAAFCHPLSAQEYFSYSLSALFYALISRFKPPAASKSTSRTHSNVWFASRFYAYDSGTRIGNCGGLFWCRTRIGVLRYSKTWGTFIFLIIWSSIK